MRRDVDAALELPLAADSVSRRIRERLVRAGRRFHANDNIAEHLRSGELEELKAEVRDRLQQVLAALVIDTDSDHNTSETAQRVARMFIDEVFRGRYVTMPPVTEFPNSSSLSELMIVGPIKVRSACSPICARSWAGSGSACCRTNTPT